jgi:hypothetical protein
MTWLVGLLGGFALGMADSSIKLIAYGILTLLLFGFVLYFWPEEGN